MRIKFINNLGMKKRERGGENNTVRYKKIGKERTIKV